MIAKALSESRDSKDSLLISEQVLPYLKPRAFDKGADLLGAHCEGPWLNPLKKGAHGSYYIARCGIAKW